MRKNLWPIVIISLASLALGACSQEPRQKFSKYTMDRDVYVGLDQESMQLWEALETKGPDIPATIIKSPANYNCRVKRALGGGVTTITAYEGDTSPAPLFFVQKQLLNIINQDDPLVAFSMKRANMTDVVVTQTDKPVNLVLTTHDANLWVIHSAPGVDIRSINVFSHEGAGVIAPGIDPSKVKFIVANEKNARCRPQRADADRDKEGYADWQKWIRSKIGRIESSFDSEYRVEAALIGPAPMQPIAPAPIGGTVIVDTSRYHDVFWGTREDAESKFPPKPDNVRFHSIKIVRPGDK
jgi:hypothetical protein